MSDFFEAFRKELFVPLIIQAAAIVLGLVIVYLGYAELTDELKDVVNIMPYIVMSAAITLSSVYKRLRILMVLIVLLVTNWLLSMLDTRFTEGWTQFTILYLYSSLSVALPLIIATYAHWHERGSALSDLGRKFVMLCALIFLVWLCNVYENQVMFGILTYFPPAILYPDWLGALPPMGFYAFLIALVLVGYQVVKSPKLINSSLFVVLLLQFMLTNMVVVEGAIPILMTLSGAILLGALIYETYHMAFMDDLTGLPGRRAFNECMAKLGRHYSIAMLDVDKFKNFNDTWGHDAGDQVLKMVAHQIGQVTGGGQAFRYGGEEFCVVFPNTDKEETMPHLEALRGKIERYKLKLRGQDRPTNDLQGFVQRFMSLIKKSENPEENEIPEDKSEVVSVTISIGVAQRNAQYNTPEEVMKAADIKLYDAKEAGRNNVQI